MKKVKLLISMFIIATMLNAQQNPTNNNPGPATNGTGSPAFWSRSGNTLAGGTNNIFGTAAGFNSPIYTETNGIVRTRLNGTLTTPINSVSQVVDGYFGIAPNGFFASNSPWAMLHLHGLNNQASGYQTGGWRKWMQTGAFMDENSDNMYVGLKNEVATQGPDRSDAVINWSDNATGPPFGPEALRFIFTANTGNNGNGINNNSVDGQSLNGYEFMRMVANTNSPLITNSAGYPVGHVGIGPLFVYGNTAPQNRLHMNSEDYVDNYLQITSAKATGQLDADGTKFGIYNVAGANDNPPAQQVLEAGNAFLYNQETRHLIFSTNHTTPTTASGGMFNTNERMRITSFNAPTCITGWYNLYYLYTSG